MMRRLAKSVRRLRGMYRVHGLYPVLSYLASKPYPIKWFYRRISRPWLIRVQIHGSTMYLDAHDPGISTSLLTEGTREPGHVAQVRGNTLPGMRGIELGANVGFYALMEARLIGPSGHIHAIEPAPGNIRLLRRNIDANGFRERFSVSQYLIGDHDGPGKLQVSALSNRHSVSADQRGQFIEVPMITLDTFMERNNIEPKDIQFLRMDIEGYEVIAFQGMKKLMTSRTPLKIFIEFHPGWYGRWGWTFERFLDYLESFSFRVRSLAFKGEEGIVTIEDPTRAQIMETQIAPRTVNGGCHGYLERA